MKQTNKETNKNKNKTNKMDRKIKPNIQTDFSTFFFVQKSHISKDINFQKPIYSMSLLNK